MNGDRYCYLSKTNCTRATEKKKLNFKKTLKIANLNSQIKKFYLIHIFIKKNNKIFDYPASTMSFYRLCNVILMIVRLMYVETTLFIYLMSMSEYDVIEPFLKTF